MTWAPGENVFITMDWYLLIIGILSSTAIVMLGIGAFMLFKNRRD